jgi:hypothetical protein
MGKGRPELYGHLTVWSMVRSGGFAIISPLIRDVLNHNAYIKNSPNSIAMKFSGWRPILLLFSGLATFESRAQEMIPTAGGEASGGGGSLSFSAGQPFYSFHTGNDGSLTEGLQQSYVIQLITSIEEVFPSGLLYEVYPNPSAGILILKVKDTGAENLRFQLHNLNGQLLVENKISAVETPISLTGLSRAVYLLKVMEGQEVLRTFKIIKN